MGNSTNVTDGSENEAFYLDPNAASNDPGKAQGMLIDAQREDFKNRFQPLEKRLRKEISKDPEQQAKEAGMNMKRQGKVTRGSFRRDLQRSGDTLTDRQKDTIKRKRGLAEARGMANVKNLTRRNTRETNLSRKAELIGIGKGISQSARTDLSAASGMQTNRDMANANAQAAQSQQNMQMAGMAIGLAMMI